MTKVVKYLVMLNLCLALATTAGSAWVARSVGGQAYWAGATAMLVVSVAASLALLLTYLQSKSSSGASATNAASAVAPQLGVSELSASELGTPQFGDSQIHSVRIPVNPGTAVSGVLLAMLVRMGLPIVAVVFMTQTKSPLMEAGFFGLLTLNYLVALPIETFLSLQFLRTPESVAPASN